MAEPKTKVNDASVAGFIGALPDAEVRDDCRAIVKMMEAATKAKPKMWGTGIVGFGTRTIVYAGGREGDWPLAAFAPRKQNIALYLPGGLDEHEELLAKLGRHSRGKGCLYVKRLADVNLPALDKLVRAAVRKAGGAGAKRGSR